MGKGREPITKPGYIFTNPVFKRNGDDTSLTFQYNDENGERKEQLVPLAVIAGRIHVLEPVPVSI